MGATKVHSELIARHPQVQVPLSIPAMNLVTTIKILKVERRTNLSMSILTLLKALYMPETHTALQKRTLTLILILIVVIRNHYRRDGQVHIARRPEQFNF